MVMVIYTYSETTYKATDPKIPGPHVFLKVYRPSSRCHGTILPPAAFWLSDKYPMANQGKNQHISTCPQKNPIASRFSGKIPKSVSQVVVQWSHVVPTISRWKNQQASSAEVKVSLEVFLAPTSPSNSGGTLVRWSSMTSPKNLAQNRHLSIPSGS